MLTRPDADAFGDIEDHCLEYLQDVSYYYAKINGREEKGQSRFHPDRLNGGFHRFAHDLYLRHVVETKGIAPVLESSQKLSPLDRARVLTYAGIFLEDNMAWQDLGRVLEMLKPLSQSLQDKDIEARVRRLDIAQRRNR